MAKLKAFTIGWDYLANYGAEDHTNHGTYKVPVSNYDEIQRQLEECVKENNVQQLIKILHSEFVYPEQMKRYTKVTYDTFPESKYFRHDYTISNSYSSMHYHLVCKPNYGTGQRDIYTFAEHLVAPVLEELIINRIKDYKQLFSMASLDCQKVFSDFSNLELQNVDISEFDLSLANFIDSSFNGARGVTQESLDKSLSYEGAISLPKQIVPFWTDAKKNLVLAQLDQLDQYAQKLLKSADSEGREKGKEAHQLANDLRDKINSTNKYNGAFQKEFLSLLHSKDELFNHRRYYGLKMILSNIALFVLGAGVGYLVAGLVHQQLTGRFAFFTRPETEQKIATIEASIAPAAYAVK